MSRNSFFPPLQAREKAPAAWVVIKGPWMLRFIDDIPAGLYRDIPEGKPEEMVLYHIAKDRQETKNMIDETENIRDELLKIWEKEAMIFLPPARWDRRKWEGIVPPNNNYLTSQTK
jgi:hypothetical protein